jgi:uncharacterized membrane protein YuzA (DUF378 family)
MKNFNVFAWAALAVLVVGGVNWGMVGMLNIDLVSSLFGEMTILTRIVYGLVGLSALYIAFIAIMPEDEHAHKSSNQVVHS